MKLYVTPYVTQKMTKKLKTLSNLCYHLLLYQSQLLFMAIHIDFLLPKLLVTDEILILHCMPIREM